MPETSDPSKLHCPVPSGQPAEIQIGHGGGGRLTQQLIDHLFGPAFANPALADAHDGARIGGGLVVSTDAHVVSPLFFPGGDIGSLAIHGTANDLAMCGARPRWLTTAFILEEGLGMELLRRVVESMRSAAAEIGAEVVAGDTKVVERGHAEGLYLTTSGVGEVVFDRPVRPQSVEAGDVILLSGDVGRHGMAVMAGREGLEFESPIESDSAHLWPAVEALAAAGIEAHCLRDLTRGGLATALIEIAESAGRGLRIDQAAVPVAEAVRGACEILGLDPFYVANEGRMVAFVPADQAERALEALRATAVSANACRIGEVHNDGPAKVRLNSPIGPERTLDRISGEQLPRIC